jgi:hypothetical protein
MDTDAELERMCKSLELRLASMVEGQEREYEVTDKTGDIVGNVTIPVKADENEIIEILNCLNLVLDDDKEYISEGIGEDGTIEVTSEVDDETVHEFSLTTYEDIESFEEFMENVLDIERTQYLSGDGWTTKDYTVVVTTGGPHIEFTTDYRIRAYWGSGRQDYYVGNDDARMTMDRVEDYLNDLYYETNHRGSR